MLERKVLPETFKDIADAYLEYLRQIQPVGPYNLLGWSFGGLIANEVACRLQELGDRVSCLVVIDSPLQVENLEMVRVNDHDTIQDLLNISDQLYAPANPNPTGNEDKPRDALDQDSALHMLREQQLFPPSFDRDQLSHLTNIFNNITNLRETCPPSVFRGDVLFIGAGKDEPTTSMRANSWREHIDGALVRHDVDANHFEMFGSKLSEIADIINGALLKADK